MPSPVIYRAGAARCVRHPAAIARVTVDEPHSALRGNPRWRMPRTGESGRPKTGCTTRTRESIQPMSEQTTGVSLSPIRISAITRRVNALFRAMSTDVLLREQFITDPAQIASEYVYGTSIAPEKANSLNHFIYAVAASPRLLTFLRDYSAQHRGRPPPRAALVKDLSIGIQRFADHRVILSLMTQERAVTTVDTAWLRVIFGQSIFGEGVNAVTGVTGTGITGTAVTGTGVTGTGVTGTGVTGTGVTGTGVTGTGVTGTGVTGTGVTGTGVTGTGITGTGITGTDATGTLTGTDATGTGTGTDATGTGTGTDATGTGTGTDATGTDATGTDSGTSEFGAGDFGIFWSPDAAVTLEGLIQHATQLLRSGALDHVG